MKLAESQGVAEGIPSNITELVPVKMEPHEAFEFDKMQPHEARATHSIRQSAKADLKRLREVRQAVSAEIERLSRLLRNADDEIGFLETTIDNANVIVEDEGDTTISAQATKVKELPREDEGETGEGGQVSIKLTPEIIKKGKEMEAQRRLKSDKQKGKEKTK